MCQKEHWTHRRRIEGVPHRLKKGMSTSEDAGPEGVELRVLHRLEERTSV